MYEKYPFDPDYQDAILACLVAHPEAFMPYAGIFNSAYFTGVQRIASARALLKYWRENARFPSKETVKQIIFDAITRTAEERDEDTILDYAEKLLNMDTGDFKDVSKHCIEWAKRRAIWIAVEEAGTAFQAGEVPPDGFVSKFKKALEVGANLEDLGYIIGPEENDIAKIIADYTKEGYAISSGFPLLDDVMPSRGFEPGWLISILAPPKHYKTTFCINLALNICAQGRPVLYYPCEITQKLAAIRTLSKLTDRTIDYMRKDPKGFVGLAVDEARYCMGSPLLIKGYPSKAVTIAGDIRTHALTARDQLEIEPGAVFIDFAETVRAMADPKRTSEHRAQGEIYIEARALAAELNCPVFLPDRCNRETAQKTVPDPTSFQGSYEKAGIVDLGIGLCADETEMISNVIRYFIFLNRHGPPGHHFRGTVVPDRFHMTLEEKIRWNPEDEESVSKDKKDFSRRTKARQNRDKNKDRNLPRDLQH